jgi:hypothetical protein
MLDLILSVNRIRTKIPAVKSLRGDPRQCIEEMTGQLRALRKRHWTIWKFKNYRMLPTTAAAYEVFPKKIVPKSSYV